MSERRYTMVNICLSLDISEINKIWGSDCSIVVHTLDDFYVVDNIKLIDYPIDEIRKTLDKIFNSKSKRIITDGSYIYYVTCVES